MHGIRQKISISFANICDDRTCGTLGRIAVWCIYVLIQKNNKEQYGNFFMLISSDNYNDYLTAIKLLNTQNAFH